MDIQTVLVFILALLTINLIIVGIFVVRTLKELRGLIEHAHDVLDSASSVTSIVSTPLGSISNLVSAVVEGYKMVQKSRSK